MTGRDLAAEMAAAGAAVRVGHLERLRALGVSYQALAALNAVQPTIGVGRVVTGRDGLFQFSEEGDGAVIQAVTTADRELGDAGIIDLIAWKSGGPSRWWWRSGSGFALGGDLLHDDLDVAVVATPAEWLALSGAALCVLDWDNASPAWPLIRSGPSLTFTNDLLHQRVRKALLATAPMPSMRIFNDAA